MNQIIVNGIIRDIEKSHSIGDVIFEKANVVCINSNGKESILNIKYKKYANSTFENGSEVNFVGNVRSFSEKIGDKNRVNVYIYTYFDSPDVANETGNTVDIDGRICSIEPLRELSNGKQNIHFILANNIIVNDKKINSYIPCIAWGKVAKSLSTLGISSKIHIINGELRSREYVKRIGDDEEIRVCHELYVQEYEIVED